jgi:WD40 repeat protein
VQALTTTGMVMAVKLAQHPASNSTLALVGYEGGHTAIHQILHNDSASLWPAELVYLSQPHSQPVLSLDITPDAKTYFTSAADAIIAAHRVPDLSTGPLSGRRARTALPERSPAYNKGMPQPQSNTPTSNLPKDPSSQSPPTSLTFAKQPILPPQSSSSPSKPTGISSLLASAPPPSTTIFPAPLKPLPRTVQPPHKSTNTKHAGQQSLRVRSDGRVLVTGGWDSRIRMYSTATLKEIAVLKWHKEGVYAVDFAQILTADQWRENDGDERKERETGLGKLQKQREEQMQVKRWVVGGAKDGKVSLWEVG